MAIGRRIFNDSIARSAGAQRTAWGFTAESDEGNMDKTTRSKRWQRHQMPHDTTKPRTAVFTCEGDVAIDRRTFDDLIAQSAGAQRPAWGFAGESDEGDTVRF